MTLTRSNARACRTLLALLFFAPLAPSAGLLAQGPRITGPRDVVQCEKCHANRDFLVGKAKTERGDSALFVPRSVLAGSRHAKLGCADCHPGYNAGYPHSTTAVAVACQKCHEKEGDAWAKSIHAPNAKTKGDAPSCVACHGQHDVRAADDPTSPTYALNVAKLCGSCHNDRRIVGTYFKTTKGADTVARTAVVEYYKTVHGTAASRAGLVVAATCNDCHDAHLVLPADSALSTINRAHVAETCGSCHAGVLATFDSSSHGKALVSGKKTDTKHGAPVCTDCHVGHKIVAANDSAWFRGVVSECGSCHERLTKTYFETYHGQVTQLGFGITAKCSDCHTAHAMLPPTDPKSSVNAANIVATCAKCHPGANAKFAQYMPHGDPQDRAKNPGLFYVWAFMTALLIGVFAFFGLHTVLWLTRLTINRLRGGDAYEMEHEAEHEPEGDGRGVAAPKSTMTETEREPVGSGAAEDK